MDNNLEKGFYFSELTIKRVIIIPTKLGVIKMLRPCSKEEFKKYADFIADLAMDPTKCSYPVYYDEISTKEDFIEDTLKSFEKDDVEILLFEYEGKVEGLIRYFWIPEDLYMQTVCFNINNGTEQALSEFLEYVSKRFSGYDLYLGFPADNIKTINYFEKQGIECIENDYNNIAFLEKINLKQKNQNIVHINKNNYPLFQSLHSQNEEDIYWNSKRILEDLDNWFVFVKEENGIALGAVYYTFIPNTDGDYEIFGIDIDQNKFDLEFFKELLCSALLDVKQRNGKHVVFFCDKEYEQTAIDCGFTCIGNYLCFKTRL